MKIRVPLPCKRCNDRHVEIVGDRLHCCHCHDDRGAADPTMIRVFEEIERARRLDKTRRARAKQIKTPNEQKGLQWQM